MQPSLSTVLDEAADIISRPQSWTRGVDCDVSKGSPCGTKFCLRGGLQEAVSHLFNGIDWEVVDNAMSVVQAEIDRSYPELVDPVFHAGPSVTAWNDQQRDKRKVVRLLRRTARRLRAGLA